MTDGLILIAVSLALLAISRDASRQVGEINQWIAAQRFEGFPRLRRFNQRVAAHSARRNLIWGRLVGVAGLIGGVILIARDL